MVFICRGKNFNDFMISSLSLCIVLVLFFVSFHLAQHSLLLDHFSNPTKYNPKMPAGLHEDFWGELTEEGDTDAASEDLQQLVSEVMPQIRAIHSKASAAKVVEKAISEC